MRKLIIHPDLAELNIELESKVLAVSKAHSILQNGKPAKNEKSDFYYVTDNNNNQIEFEILKSGIFTDPFPNLRINGVLFQLWRPYKWYETLLIFFPLVLIVGGGILGGIIGVFFGYANNYVFRNEELTTPLKILIAIGINGAAFMTWFLIAIAIALVLNGSS